METPIHLGFQGKEPQADLRAEIARQVAVLEERFGRITACRVVVKDPGQHHRTSAAGSLSWSWTRCPKGHWLRCRPYENGPGGALFKRSLPEAPLIATTFRTGHGTAIVSLRDGDGVAMTRMRRERGQN